MTEGLYPRIMIVAGEASGDMHAASLIRELRRLYPFLRVNGLGGRELLGQGLIPIAGLEELAVTGVTEVARHLPAIFRVLGKLERVMDRERPDVVILVDYPDFNFRVAKAAKERGLPVVYYISPQIWAWRRRRVYTLKRLVSKMLVVFPFEVEFYEKARVPVEFVGHPLVDRVKGKIDLEGFFRRTGLSPEKRYLAILPGSRMNEVRRHLLPMLRTAEIVAAEIPGLEVLLPIPPNLDPRTVRGLVATHDISCRLLVNESVNALAVSEAALVKSGTSTLECALTRTPCILMYRLSLVSWLIARALVDVRYIGLINIVAGQSVAPEFIQDAVDPDLMARELLDLMNNQVRRAEVLAAMAEVEARLQGADASRLAAEAVSRELAQHRPALLPYYAGRTVEGFSYEEGT